MHIINFKKVSNLSEQFQKPDDATFLMLDFIFMIPNKEVKVDLTLNSTLPFSRGHHTLLCTSGKQQLPLLTNDSTSSYKKMPESQISVDIILKTTTNEIQNMFSFACIILHSLTVSLSHRTAFPKLVRLLTDSVD